MDRLMAMETFVRVVDTGSFSAAARHLRVGQPAVSKTVGQLEERLGVKLLARSTPPDDDGSGARFLRPGETRDRRGRRGRSGRARRRRRPDQPPAHLRRGHLRAPAHRPPPAGISRRPSGPRHGCRARRPDDRPRPGGHRHRTPDGRPAELFPHGAPDRPRAAAGSRDAGLFRPRGRARQSGGSDHASSPPRPSSSRSPSNRSAPGAARRIPRQNKS
jgi:Bacterial regulatory helix-turn-helix protein, lysR family